MNVLTDNKVKMMKPHYRVTQYLHSLDFWSKFETFYFPKGFDKKKRENLHVAVLNWLTRSISTKSLIYKGHKTK
jgi:hypothetical protein